MEQESCGMLWNAMEQKKYGSYEKLWNRKVLENYEKLSCGKL